MELTSRPSLGVAHEPMPHQRPAQEHPHHESATPGHVFRTAVCGSASRMLALGVGLSLGLVWWGMNVSQATLFAFHTLFMSVGLVLVMTEGVLRAMEARATHGPHRTAALKTHMALQLGAVVCLGAGFLTIFANKVRKGKPHFATLHAKLGLACLVLSCAAALGGAAAFRWVGLYDKLPGPLHAAAKPAHRVVGRAAWLLGVAAVLATIGQANHDMGLATAAWQAGLVVLICAMALRALGPWGGGKGHGGVSSDDGLETAPLTRPSSEL
ncbi:unnamed protein product [Pedinophyceae sp. YPF-701]|nr:unnamed protein product [Pedinophyceae sp. YPF-701]